MTRHHYILAGGKSRRFGSDKARALKDGTPLIARLNTMLAPHGPVTVVAQSEDAYADLGLICIKDIRPGQHGPLAGLEAALTHRLSQHGEGWIVLLSCDLTDWKEKDILPLIETTNASLQAGVWRQADGFFHPLPGWYHTRALPDLRQALDEHIFSFQQWLPTLQAHHQPMTQKSFAQANRSEDLCTD